MYARVARFESGDPGRIDDDIAEMKKQMASARSGELPADAPEQVRTLMDTGEPLHGTRRPHYWNIARYRLL